VSTSTVITITHSKDSNVDIKIQFLPRVKTTGPLSPAHALGAEFLSFIKTRNEVLSEKVGITPVVKKKG
jgi:hypothetical protein